MYLTFLLKVMKAVIYVLIPPYFCLRSRFQHMNLILYTVPCAYGA